MRREPHYEVAEFFGPGYWHYNGADGQIVEAPRFEEANQFPRFYPAAGTRRSCGKTPVVAPGGVWARFYALSDSALRMLASLGLVLR